MSKKSLANQKMENQIVLYIAENGKVNITVNYLNDTFWLPQKAISSLFGVEVPAISKHLNNIYLENELNKESTISILETVQQEGNRSVKRNVEYYNLDAIFCIIYCNSFYFSNLVQPE